MLLGCGDNDTSSLIDDERARTSSTYVDPKKIHCRFARFLCAYTIGQGRCTFRIRIVNLIINFKIVYLLRVHGAPSQKHGFVKREEELCFQTSLTAGMQFSRLCLC